MGGPSVIQSKRRAFTKIELAIVLVALFTIFCLLIPGIHAAREAARRANCLNNLKGIGLGFVYHDQARRRFPPTSSVAEDPSGKITALDGVAGTGWNWAVHTLPFQMGSWGYDILDLREDYPLSGSANNVIALGSPHKQYICPSFRGSMYVDPAPPAGFEFITNYKVLSATHTASLAQATMIADPSKPAYEGDHPDGVCYPGSKHGSADCTDGTATTLLVAETTEQYFARWMVGVETLMVGLPDSAATFDNADDTFAFARPKGFTKDNFWDRSTVTNNQTYLDWDYSKTPYDSNGVLSAPGGLVSTVRAPAFPPTLKTPPKTMQIGPSSHHRGVINHLFADGHVQSISKDIDTAAYTFLITRAGGDPAAPTE